MRMVITAAVLLILQLLPVCMVSAHADPQLDQALPTVEISELGLLRPAAGTIRYKPWDSDSLRGKVWLIQHLPGRRGYKKINQPLIDQIKANRPSLRRFQVLNIINGDDAVWGMGSFVKSEVEKSQLANPSAAFVLDDDGVALETWGLQEKQVALILVDKYSKVLFFKHGALQPEEQEVLLKQIFRLASEDS